MRLKITFIFLIFLCMVSLASASFNITGYTKGINADGGIVSLNNTNITVEIYQANFNGPPSLNATISNSSNESGYFYIEINDTYAGNESFMYKIILRKYNDEGLAQYVGPNLPYFPKEQLEHLGTVYFYLRPGITIDISATGPEYVTEDASKIEYTLFNNFSTDYTDYKAGIEIINDSGEKNYVYLNSSDCLIFLNETFNFNRSVCDLNITNINDFTFNNNTVYLINLTEIQVCNIDSGNFVCNDEDSTALTSQNFAIIGGISYNEFLGPEGRIFVSAQNSSGKNHVYIYNSSNLTMPLHDWYVPGCYVGKMLFSGSGGGFGIGNNSGRYTLYKIFIREDDFSCDNPLNLTEGLIIKGFAEDPFEEKYYIVNDSREVINIDFFTNEFGFKYQFKDKKLGYSVEESFNELKYTSRAYLPADRNYSFMIYPQGGPAFPVSIELNNLAHGNNISLGTTENRTITSINQSLYLNLSNLNLTTGMVQLSGYSLFNESAGFDNYAIIAYLLEAGNMVFSKGMMPQNMGQKTGQNINDVFNKTSGFYNMTLPAAIYGADILLFATAKKDGKWYGGFRTISLTYGESPGQLNITLYPMVGNEAILESQFMEFGEPANTSLLMFNFTEANCSSDECGVTNVHSEISVDYSEFNGSNVTFSWMADSGNENTIKIPLLNDSVNIKIFSPQYPPIKRTVSVGDIQEGIYNIPLEELKAKKPNGDEISGVQFRNFKYKDDGSCSVPWPNETPGDNGCLPDGVGNGGGPVNPFTWVISGGKYDLEMRMNTTNITVHYVNVDLLASQPPDARFDDSGNKTTSGSLMQEAWRFGSTGPNIYDYVIIGVPYNASAINESSEMKINITKFHDENWQPVWEQGEGLDELNGTEYEDYKEDLYVEYINGSAVLCNESDENLTSGVCYKDTAHNMLWFKIPHFSGIEPTIVGQAITTTTSNESEENNNGGGGGTLIQRWTKEVIITNNDLITGKTIALKKNERAKFNITNEEHYVGIINITNTTVTIEVASNPQNVTLSLGETKKFNFNNDDYYDLSVTLISINSSYANISIKAINEKITTTQQPTNETTPTTGETEKEALFKLDKKIYSIIAVIILVIIIILISVSRKKKRYYKKGY